jgi:SAM-dependent methyltransferase
VSSAIAKAQEVIDSLLARAGTVAVLEAGCGSTSRVRLPQRSTLTGIDISAQQLARNPQLDLRIQGDLQTHDWCGRAFDLVVCWDVLEHLARPADALARMLAAVAPGGVVLLALPNLYSIKGLVTKFTPYGFHVWFYRHVMGDRSPREEFGQFPTYLRRDIGPARLATLARAAGFTVRHLELYEGPVQADLRARNRFADACFALAGMLGRVLSAGRYDPNRTDMIVVLQRRPRSQASGSDTPDFGVRHRSPTPKSASPQEAASSSR